MKRIRRLSHESTPATKVSFGKSLAVRPGKSPGIASISKATTLGVRPGKSPGLASVSKGATLAMRGSFHDKNKGFRPKSRGR